MYEQGKQTHAIKDPPRGFDGNQQVVAGRVQWYLKNLKENKRNINCFQITCLCHCVLMALRWQGSNGETDWISVLQVSPCLWWTRGRERESLQTQNGNVFDNYEENVLIS
jgi:hypothetical protein